MRGRPWTRAKTAPLPIHSVVMQSGQLNHNQTTRATMPRFILLLSLLCSLVWAQEHRGSVDAAYASLSRSLGRNASDLFVLSLDPTSGNCTTVDNDPSGKISIVASAAVDLVYSAARYLREVCNASFAWPLTGDNQVASVPTVLPRATPTRWCRAVPYTYKNNVVEFSYSAPWWDLARWQRELDWMAAHGVNLCLAYTGQEALFRDVYLSLGLTDPEIAASFNGPAFLAWSRGQGQSGVGGALPSWWYAQQLELNQAVFKELLALGITPVLPVFQGNVPLALHTLFPSANISKEGWLDVFDPLFGRIQDAYMQRLLAAYGNTTHWYEADGLFASTGGPWVSQKQRGEPSVPGSSAEPPAGSLGAPDPDAQARSRAAYESFAKHDPAAVWVYQSWIWRGFHVQDIPYLQGWLSGPPLGRMLLLDQTAEWTPIWSFFNNFSFFGQPFAWLSMNNMGGNLGLVGSLEAVNQGVAAAATYGHGGLRAVGLDPEGINQNPVFWEFVTDSAWRAGLANTSAYLEDWGVRRCGVDSPGVREAWALLGQTVYSPVAPAYEHHMKYCGTTMPVAGSGWDSPMIRAGYAPALLARAWQALLAAAPSCLGTSHLHDLIDVTREFLVLFPCVAGHDALLNATTVSEVDAAAATLAEVMADLDTALATQQGFLVGAWIADAVAMAPANDSASALQLEWNARSQVSSWFPTPAAPTNGLWDYANKQWQGLTRDFYAPRYSLYAARAAAAISARRPFNTSGFVQDVSAAAAAWTTGHLPGSRYPAQPTGDALAVSQALYDKFAAQYAR